MYVLILTLFGGTTGAPAIAGVSPFVDKQACETAGKEWLKGLDDHDSSYSYTYAFYTCAPEK